MSDSNNGFQEQNPYLNGGSENKTSFANLLKDDNRKFTLIAVVLIIVVLGIVLANGNSSSDKSTFTQANTENWKPAGFFDYSEDFAYRWKEDVTVNCDGCNYWNIQVASKYDCENGIEGSLKVTYDIDGSLFGNVYSQETYFVPSGQTVDLLFKIYPRDSMNKYSGVVAYLGCKR
jgi:hypothetical protein